jgi:hypothetical protein
MSTFPNNSYEWHESQYARYQAQAAEHAAKALELSPDMPYGTRMRLASRHRELAERWSERERYWLEKA